MSTQQIILEALGGSVLTVAVARSQVAIITLYMPLAIISDGLIVLVGKDETNLDWSQKVSALRTSRLFLLSVFYRRNLM